MGRATFNGRHNELKGKTFLLLYQELPRDNWFTCRELAWTLGVSARSLRTKLPQWYAWRRIRRRLRRDSLYSCYEYQISKSGAQWFERWKDSMPIKDYVAEIRAYQMLRKSKSDMQ